MSNNRCQVALHSGHAFFGLGGWFLAMAILAFTLDIAVFNPHNYLHIHGDKAILARALWIAASTTAFVIRMTALQKIMMLYRFKYMTLVARFLWMLGMLVLPPIIEIHSMFKLGLQQRIIVPNFWCEHQEPASINATKLTESIREKYFAKAEDDDSPDIIISTHAGTLVTLLIRESSVYMYVMLGEGGELPLDTTLPPNSRWHIEKSSDGKSGALVCEVFFAPCSAGTGKLETELAEIITDDLLDEFAKFETGGC